MDSQAYRRVSDAVKSHRNGPKLLATLDRTLVFVVAGSYLALVIFLAATEPLQLPRIILVPALSFLFMSALRALIDAPRPYEVLDFDPIIVKDTRGKSFPGRHAFSAAIIACAFFSVNAWLGIVYLLIALLIAAIRVIGGVHYPRDVIAGILLALACGVVGFGVM